MLLVHSDACLCMAFDVLSLYAIVLKDYDLLLSVVLDDMAIDASACSAVKIRF